MLFRLPSLLSMRASHVKEGNKNIKTAEIKPLLYDITDHLFGMPEKMPDISISFGKTNTHTDW